MAGLREEKKRRTRETLIEVALTRFDEHGYDGTTVADIAAAAGVSPATFFNYFAGKEDVVFADQYLYDEVLDEVFATAGPAEPLGDLVVRTVHALATKDSWSFPLDHPLTAVRTRLLASVPVLRAGYLLRNAVVGDRWARKLHETYAPRLDEVEAAALTGAVLGALQAALQANLDDAGHPRRPASELAPATVARTVRGFLPPG